MKESIKNNARRYKESFRAQAITKGVANNCVIDNNTYTELSCAKGCFQDGDEWIVYYTDERGTVYGKQVHQNPQSAYTDLAKRLGFVYRVPTVVASAKTANVLIKAAKPYALSGYKMMGSRSQSAVRHKHSVNKTSQKIRKVYAIKRRQGE